MEGFVPEKGDDHHGVQGDDGGKGEVSRDVRLRRRRHAGGGGGVRSHFPPILVVLLQSFSGNGLSHTLIAAAASVLRGFSLSRLARLGQALRP